MCIRDSDIGIRAFDELVQQADVIALHLPLMDSTRHLINREAIANMKPGTILINASRGGIIDEAAAYEALKSGKLGGLGLDAFEIEPPTGSPLFELNNVVVTPHTGAHTQEATDHMASGCLLYTSQNIIYCPVAPALSSDGEFCFFVRVRAFIQ